MSASVSISKLEDYAPQLAGLLFLYNKCIVSGRYLVFKKEVFMFIAAVLLAMGISGSGLFGQGTSPPDVKNFTAVMSKELEFRIDDYKTGLVGRIVVYQNPKDPKEFVRVYYRQVAIVSERAKEGTTSGADSHDADLSNLKYHSKEEAEVLGRVQKAMDAFAYVQWRTVRDPRSGQDIRDGYFKSWLLESNGNWTVGNGYDLNTSPFSEPSKDNPKERIIVGIKFSLVGAVHIVRIDQDDLAFVVKEATNEKK